MHETGENPCLVIPKFSYFKSFSQMLSIQYFVNGRVVTEGSKTYEGVVDLYNWFQTRIRISLFMNNFYVSYGFDIF